MAGRDIQTSFVSSLPDSVTNDATGRLTLSLGAKLGRDGMTAGLCFAAAMTTRSSEGGCPDADGTLPVLWPEVARTLQRLAAGDPPEFQRTKKPYPVKG